MAPLHTPLKLTVRVPLPFFHLLVNVSQMPVVIVVPFPLRLPLCASYALMTRNEYEREYRSNFCPCHSLSPVRTLRFSFPFFQSSRVLFLFCIRQKISRRRDSNHLLHWANAHKACINPQGHGALRNLFLWSLAADKNCSYARKGTDR